MSVGGLSRRMNVASKSAVGLLALMAAMGAWAQAAPAGPATLPLLVGQGASGTSYSVPIQTLLFFTALSFLPALLLMMTGFTRIVIVLSLMRQALAPHLGGRPLVSRELFMTLKEPKRD